MDGSGEAIRRRSCERKQAKNHTSFQSSQWRLCKVFCRCHTKVLTTAVASSMDYQFKSLFYNTFLGLSRQSLQERKDTFLRPFRQRI